MFFYQHCVFANCCSISIRPIVVLSALCFCVENTTDSDSEIKRKNNVTAMLHNDEIKRKNNVTAMLHNDEINHENAVLHNIFFNQVVLARFIAREKKTLIDLTKTWKNKVDSKNDFFMQIRRKQLKKLKNVKSKVNL